MSFWAEMARQVRRSHPYVEIAPSPSETLLIEQAHGPSGFSLTAVRESRRSPGRAFILCKSANECENGCDGRLASCRCDWQGVGFAEASFVPIHEALAAVLDGLEVLSARQVASTYSEAFVHSLLRETVDCGRATAPYLQWGVVSGAVHEEMKASGDSPWGSDATYDVYSMMLDQLIATLPVMNGMLMSPSGVYAALSAFSCEGETEVNFICTVTVYGTSLSTRNRRTSPV